MARSSSSVAVLLRKFSRRSLDSRALTSSSSTPRAPLRGRQFDENGPVLSPSTRSDDPYFFPFSRSLHLERRKDVLDKGASRIARVLSRSGLEVCSSHANSRTDVVLNGSPEFKPHVQRCIHQSQYARAPFMLNPLRATSHRGLAFFGAKDDTQENVTSTNLSDGSTEDLENVVHGAKDWAETAYSGVVDSAKAVQQAVDGAEKPIIDLLEAYPVIRDVSVPVAWFTGAWVILPRVLRRLHGYVEQGSAALQQGQVQVHTVPYELSAWKAMEDPARLFATMLTLLQVVMLVTPRPELAEYMNQLWNGGSVLCGVWFLHRWKTNALRRWLDGGKLNKKDRERYSALDKLSSLGLIFLAALAVAEAAGVAVSSLLTVGGIGGIVTAFAAREILSNLLTGLTLSFSKTFSVGDTIKAGAVEGKVEEVGLTSTRLLNLEKTPLTVPNAFFTSQAILNKSQAPWRFLSVKIPIKLQDFEKVPTITLEVREMLYRNPHVYLDEDKPCCHIAQFSPIALEIAITCNIKPMSKSEYFLVEQDILLEAARIITLAGATLGGP